MSFYKPVSVTKLGSLPLIAFPGDPTHCNLEYYYCNSTQFIKRKLKCFPRTDLEISWESGEVCVPEWAVEVR